MPRAAEGSGGWGGGRSPRRGDAGEVQGRCRGDAGEIKHRCMGSIQQGRCKGDAGEIKYRCMGSIQQDRVPAMRWCSSDAVVAGLWRVGSKAAAAVCACIVIAYVLSTWHAPKLHAMHTHAHTHAHTNAHIHAHRQCAAEGRRMCTCGRHMCTCGRHVHMRATCAYAGDTCAYAGDTCAYAGDTCAHAGDRCAYAGDICAYACGLHTSSDCIHDSKAHVYAHLLRLYPRLKGRLAALTLTPANECTRRADLRAHAHMSCATWVGICAHVMHMLMDMLRGGIGLWCIPHSLPLPTPYDSLYSPLPTTPYYSLTP